MNNKLTKPERIDKVIYLIIKNIHYKLIPELKNEILSNSAINNQHAIEKFINAKLGLKSYSIASYNYWIKRGWSETEAENNRLKIKVYHSPMQVNTWTNKINPLTNINYTIQEAEIKIKSQRKSNKEYYLKLGQTEENAILSVSEYQTIMSKKFTDKIKLNPEKYTDRTATQLNYWLKLGYNKDDAVKELYKRQQTNTLKKCIELFGETDGSNIYKKRCIETGYKNTLKYYIEKYGDIDGKIKFNKKISNNRRFRSSKQAYLFFIQIYKYLRLNGLNKNDIYWVVGESKEYFLTKENGGIYFYDFTIPKLNLILEYNGIGFHPNPKWSQDKWNNWFSVFDKLTADEKCAIDTKKRQAALNKHFTHIDIFSDDNLEVIQKDIIDIIKYKINKL